VTTSTTAEFPAFVFERQHHVETEAGFVLARLLIVDLPESSKMSDEEVCLLGETVQQLGELAESGKMPDDAIVTGWRGGRKPPTRWIPVTTHSCPRGRKDRSGSCCACSRGVARIICGSSVMRPGTRESVQEH
jgi:hypothetical protein